MDVNILELDLPLLELFTKLRQAGLPLGIDEYHLLVIALQGGFGIPCRDALSRLCKTLWIKSSEEELLFDYHFEQLIPPFDESEPILPLTDAFSDQSPIEFTETPSELPPVQSPKTIFPDETPTAFETTPVIREELALEMDDEIQAVKAVLQTTTTDIFIQTDEYFPLTRRQMKQSWRYLRRPIREGPPIELDVEATVRSIERCGRLLSPVLVPQRTNRVDLLLLIDQGGSMVPFHLLSSRLAETALRGGRLGKASLYSFHNCPLEYLDSTDQTVTPIQEVLEQVHYTRSVMLLFSDAGAARGGFNRERVKMTKEFLDRVRQYVRYVAWLNPMPRSRWADTTASEIMHLVSMFDLSRRGLDNAISVLRGRLTPQIYGERVL